MGLPISRADVARHMGRRVLARRNEAELSTDDLAHSIGRSAEYVTAVEEGRASLSAEDIVALCELLEVPPSWFFDGLI